MKRLMFAVMMFSMLINTLSAEEVIEEVYAPGVDAKKHSICINKRYHDYLCLDGNVYKRKKPYSLRFVIVKGKHCKCTDPEYFYYWHNDQPYIPPIN